MISGEYGNAAGEEREVKVCPVGQLDTLRSKKARNVEEEEEEEKKTIEALVRSVRHFFLAAVGTRYTIAAVDAEEDSHRLLINHLMGE